MKLIYSLCLVVVIAFCAIIPAFAQEPKELGNLTGNETPMITPMPDPTPKPIVTPTPITTPKPIYDIPVALQVTDSHTKKTLTEMDINPANVMLIEDYSAEHPTVQKFIDLKSKQTIAVFDSLPKVNSNGEPIVVGWDTSASSDWVALPNLFTAEVYGTEIRLAKDGERSWWNPELYLDGHRIQPISQKAVRIDDPYNPNYQNNVLNWDYGICIRELRVIEGAIFERWIFQSNPQGEVIVKHRQGGHLKLEFGFMHDATGRALTIEVEQNDWEIVNSVIFDNPTIQYPLYLFASATYSIALDGGVERYVDTGDTWTHLRDGHGNGAYSTSAFGVIMEWYASEDAPVNEFEAIIRGILVFDTSALNDGVTVTAATMSMYGYQKIDIWSDNPSVNIYSATTLYDDELYDSDYETISTTAWSATPITYAAWSTTGYNDWVLNAAGLAGISKTGYTTMGTRDVPHDVGDVAPTWNTTLVICAIGAYFSEQGTGYQPKLVVTYTPATPDITSNAASAIGMTSARLNGVLTNDGGELNAYRVGYGNSSKTAGNFSLYDTVTAWSDYSYDTGDNLYLDASGLLSNTLYYYRFQTKNTVGNDTSDEMTFTTLFSVVAPTDFIATPSSTSILLSFTKGMGATDTVIRYAYDTYPTLITGGTLAGNTTGTFVTHSPLDNGKTVYYSAWSVSGGNTSTGYATAVGTTLLAGVADYTGDTPILPTGFSQATDYTAFSGLPGYGGINSLADTMNVPRATLWLILQFGIMLGLAVAIGLIAGASIGAIAGIGAGVGFVIIGGMPSGFLMILALFALAYGIFRWRTA